MSLRCCARCKREHSEAPPAPTFVSNPANLQSVVDWGKPAAAAPGPPAPPRLPAGWIIQSDGTVGGTFYVDPDGKRHWPGSLQASS
jgi:hypothetical protein